MTAEELRAIAQMCAESPRALVPAAKIVPLLDLLRRIAGYDLRRNGKQSCCGFCGSEPGRECMPDCPAPLLEALRG